MFLRALVQDPIDNSLISYGPKEMEDYAQKFQVGIHGSFNIVPR